MKNQIIEIPKYIRQVRLSEKRITKYYEQGKKAPKSQKYYDKTKYDWKSFAGRLFLVDLKSGERVIANPRAQGTPRDITINGQKIYNGEVNKNVRNKILSEIKSSFAPYVDKLEPVPKGCPIRIEMEIHDVIKSPGSGAFWDLDNRSYPYIKAFQDCLTGNRIKGGKATNKVIVPEDHVMYITQPPVPLFIPVENEEDRKLVFRLIKETDDRILKHKIYQEELSKLKV